MAQGPGSSSQARAARSGWAGLMASEEAEVCLSAGPGRLASLLEAVYVGVSLQRRAKESLVSSSGGGAEAMLPSY